MIKKNGFTIIELLITSFLLSITLILVFPLFSVTYNNLNNYSQIEKANMTFLKFISLKDSLLNNTDLITYINKGNGYYFYLNDNSIECIINTKMKVNDYQYDLNVKDVEINNNFIVIKLECLDMTYSFFIKGENYEICND